MSTKVSSPPATNEIMDSIPESQEASTEESQEVSADEKEKEATPEENHVKAEDSESEEGGFKAAENSTPVAKGRKTKAGAAKSPKTPKTPKAPKTPKTPKSGKRAAANEDGEASGEGSPTKKRKPAKEVNASMKIATSMDELSTADRLLISMKDANKSWAEINAAWKDATGQMPGKSTLPNRYTRLKANLHQMSKEDQERLLPAYQKVVDRFEKEKWGLLAKQMLEDGATEDYSTAMLQKNYKKVSDARAASVAGSAEGSEAGAESQGADGTNGEDIKEEEV